VNGTALSYNINGMVPIFSMAYSQELYSSLIVLKLLAIQA
jgi:hypothetical protein